MRKIILLFLVVLNIACSQARQIDSGERYQAEAAPLTTQADCIVDEEWLNLDYDHKVDYINSDIPTDFFLLVYSNSPSFCDYQKKRGNLNNVRFQCSSPNEFGWVIHGLWGESKSAYINDFRKEHPRFCQGDLEALSLETLKPYLCMSPGTSLLQGEWEKHGSCDFNTAQEYFGKTQELYERFNIPPANLDAKNAVQWVKNNNAELKDKRLHVTKHEFGICFTTNFKPISCPKKSH